MFAVVYLKKNFDPRKLPEEKVIKTLIYGVKSNASEAEKELRKTAKLSAKENSQANQIAQNDIYVDDCLSGEKML